MGSTYAKPLDEISNQRIQKMFLDVSHVNLVFKHVPGILNSTTDYRSRHPRDSWEATGEEDSQMRLRLGVRSIRAQEIDLEPVDVRLERLAERAKNDPDYQRMVKYLDEGTPVEEMDKDSELYLMEGERQFMGTFKCSNGYSLIVKNMEEVLIPKEAREAVLEEMHSTHLGIQGMKKLARGKMTWINMSRDIERKHANCEACLINARSKPNKNNNRCEVVPSSLELTVAGEKIAADFGEYGRNKLLIIKDRYSGLIRVYTLPDMSMKSATRGYLKWAHSYGIAAEIRTDGGPGFGKEFSEGCNTIGTTHIKSPAYNPASNGAAERGVGQIKNLLEKLGEKSLMRFLSDPFEKWI